MLLFVYHSNNTATLSSFSQATTGLPRFADLAAILCDNKLLANTSLLLHASSSGNSSSHYMTVRAGPVL